MSGNRSTEAKRIHRRPGGRLGRRLLWTVLVAAVPALVPGVAQANVVTPHAVKPKVVIPKVVTSPPAMDPAPTPVPAESSAPAPTPEVAPEPAAEPAPEPAPASPVVPSAVASPSAAEEPAVGSGPSAPTAGECRDGSCEPPIPTGGSEPGLDPRLARDSLAAVFIGQLICPLWLTFSENVYTQIEFGRIAGLANFQMSDLMAELENARAHIWRSCVTTRDP